MELSSQEAALDARAQHGKHKDPQPALRQRERCGYRNHSPPQNQREQI